MVGYGNAYKLSNYPPNGNWLKPKNAINDIEGFATSPDAICIEVFWR
jgi:hypothetical protein